MLYRLILFKFVKLDTDLRQSIWVVLNEIARGVDFKMYLKNFTLKEEVTFWFKKPPNWLKSLILELFFLNYLNTSSAGLGKIL